MPTIVLAILIASYSGYVIFKKIKNIRAGKFCSGSCGNCSLSNQCKK
jgi:hypothetical protein